MIVEGQAAFLLHSRKYTDSRILVELLSEQYGLVSGVARQSRSKKHSGGVQPFTRYCVDWRGRSQLKTITSMESAMSGLMLSGKHLYCGFYLNELLQRALPHDDPCDSIFELYSDAVEKLADSHLNGQRNSLEITLRIFEFRLLRELGFGLDLREDLYHQAIDPQPHSWYRFIEGEGFRPEGKNIANDNSVYPGSVLVAIADEVFASTETLKFAKQLARQALRPVIGTRALNAREFFR